MSLRTKLLLLSLLTLILPWAGWQYAQQMETTLRRGQEDALLTTAEVLEPRRRQRARAALSRSLSCASEFDPARGDLFAPLLVTQPLLDGFADEWPQPARPVPGLRRSRTPSARSRRAQSAPRRARPIDASVRRSRAAVGALRGPDARRRRAAPRAPIA